MYIKKNDDNSIEECSPSIPIPGGSLIDNAEIIRAWDSKLYILGTEPTPPAPTLEDRLAAIEAKYASKQAELDSALVNALWVGGPQEASIRGSLMAKRQKLIDDRDAEIAALFA